MKIFKNRQYRTGTTWGVFLWTEVDSEYITRLHLIKTPWFAICLHWLNKPDPEPYHHDHPVTFLSLILRGWYAETRNDKVKIRRWFNFIRATASDQHTIIAVGANTLTLCLMGPKVREWGFHTPKGWVWWKDYYTAQREASSNASSIRPVNRPNDDRL